MKLSKYLKSPLIISAVFGASTAISNELEFDLDSRTKFIDMESGAEITTDPWHIKTDYKNLILDLQKYYESQCRHNNIDYVSLFTDDNLDKGLSEYFNKRQKLG